MGGNKLSLLVESLATRVTSAATEILSSEVLLNEVECIVLEGKINISSTSDKPLLLLLKANALACVQLPVSS